MGHLNNDDDKSLFKGFTVPRKSRILTDVAALLFAGDTMLLHRSATQNKSIRVVKYGMLCPLNHEVKQQNETFAKKIDTQKASSLTEKLPI